MSGRPGPAEGGHAHDTGREGSRGGGAVSDHAALSAASSTGERSVDFEARAAMDALGDPMVVIGSDWRVRYINAPWARILGVLPEIAVGADFWTTYAGFDVDPGAEMIRATASDGATRRYDLEHWVG